MPSPLRQPDAACRQAVPHIDVVEWAAASEALTALRLAVFVEEQGVPRDLELDGLDPECRHVVAWNTPGEAVGTARLHRQGDGAKIGRMAVLKPWRGLGLGRAMLAALLDEARALGVTRITLSAQAAAVGFYAKAGFEAAGPVFDDAGIPHRLMTLTLPGSGAGGRR